MASRVLCCGRCSSYSSVMPSFCSKISRIAAMLFTAMAMCSIRLIFMGHPPQNRAKITERFQFVMILRCKPRALWFQRTGCESHRSLLDDEHLSRVKFRGQELRAAFRDQEQVLAVPVIDKRLQRDHHSGLKRHSAPTTEDRLLLMPPWANAVADEP